MMVEFAKPAVFEEDELDHVPDAYRQFRDGEGVPVHSGLAVEDVAELETGYWDRTGQAGAFINLYGTEGVDDLQLHELEPRGETTTQRHVYEEIVYVTDGRGFTVLGAEDDQRTFEWSEHSLFFLPPNTPYRHVNTSEDEPARLLAQTALPQFFNLIEDPDFFFETEYDFGASDAFDYSGEGKMYRGETFPVEWDANFIPNIKQFDKLQKWDLRGAGGVSVKLPMSNSTMFAHISEFPVGTYKKAHRHGPGANVIILSGEGYSLMWREGWDRVAKVDWRAGSIVTPPARWYHQHFNTGDEAARYAAIHTPELGGLYNTAMFDPFHDENQIEYVDEDPDIREHYGSELSARGLEFRMPDECYSDPDFEF